VIHSNTNITWKATTLFEPFVAIDWQTNDSLKYAYSNRTIANSNANEFTLGGGVHINATKNFAVDIRYQRGVTGDNTILTNAVYVRLGLVF
jgi:opacity protein-like surface antigen